MPLTPSQEREAATPVQNPPHRPAISRNGPLKVSINRAAWTRLWGQTGIATDYQRAAAMGSSPAAYSLIVRGERAPTLEFLARAREALRRITDTEVRIDDLIDVAETP